MAATRELAGAEALVEIGHRYGEELAEATSRLRRRGEAVAAGLVGARKEATRLCSELKATLESQAAVAPSGAVHPHLLDGVTELSFALTAAYLGQTMGRALAPLAAVFLAPLLCLAALLVALPALYLHRYAEAAGAERRGGLGGVSLLMGVAEGLLSSPFAAALSLPLGPCLLAGAIVLALAGAKVAATGQRREVVMAGVIPSLAAYLALAAATESDLEVASVVSLCLCGLILCGYVQVLLASMEGRLRPSLVAAAPIAAVALLLASQTLLSALSTLLSTQPHTLNDPATEASTITTL